MPWDWTYWLSERVHRRPYPLCQAPARHRGAMVPLGFSRPVSPPPRSRGKAGCAQPVASPRASAW
jgi:hypothetical protein